MVPPRRGSEAFPLLGLPLPLLAERKAVTLEPCLSDALCRRPEPACRRRSRSAKSLRPPPVRVTQSSTSVEVEDCERQMPTSSFYGASLLQPSWLLPLPSSFASSPCCPPSH